MRWAAVMESTFGRRVHEIRVIQKLQQRRTNKQLRASFLRNGVRARRTLLKRICPPCPETSSRWCVLKTQYERRLAANRGRMDFIVRDEHGYLPFAHAELRAIH